MEENKVRLFVRMGSKPIRLISQEDLLSCFLPLTEDTGMMLFIPVILKAAMRMVIFGQVVRDE